MAKHHNPVGKRGSDSGRSVRRRTLPYSDTPSDSDAPVDESSQPHLRADVPPDETSQPRLKHASDIRNRVTPKDRPRITPVSQPNPTFGYRATEPEFPRSDETPEEVKAAPTSSPALDSEDPPSSAHLRMAASRRPRDLPPLVQDTHYRFVAKRSRKDDKKS